MTAAGVTDLPGGLQYVDVEAVPITALAEVLDPDRRQQLLEVAARARRLLAGRTVWNINATAHGGGVAEMLQNLLAYGRGAGVDTRWLVIAGDPEFFAITKRIHNCLHGTAGDGGTLAEDEHTHYSAVLAAQSASLRTLIGPADIVLLHDPQTAGLVDGLRATGAKVIWRCHIGCDTANVHTRAGWEFLRRYTADADAFIFSRAAYAPRWARSRLRVITPSIDPLSTKNVALDDAAALDIAQQVGLLAGADGRPPRALRRRDGGDGVLRRHRDLFGDGGTAPPPDARLVVQVSRWDRLKDMGGVMAGFALTSAAADVHLLLVGPDVAGVSDDPEGASVLAGCREELARLPAPIAARVHLVCLPMDDPDENALIVNAVQRLACVVVQKSLAEGFGLTVTEAMWKRRPVIASAVGGICDQITDGLDGVLLADPQDLAAFAAALDRVLADPALAAALGAAAHLRVRQHYLGDRHLAQYVDLFADLVGH